MSNASEMRYVNPIDDGVVIDHIKSGLGVKIFRHLRLDEKRYTTVMIIGADSKRLGRKDIIKIRGIGDFGFEELGVIDPDATVSVIENGKVVKKKTLSLPERVENVIICKNPRCVTSVEPLPHVFTLADGERALYKCLYCEDLVNGL